MRRTIFLALLGAAPAAAAAQSLDDARPNLAARVAASENIRRAGRAYAVAFLDGSPFQDDRIFAVPQGAALRVAVESYHDLGRDAKVWADVKVYRLDGTKTVVQRLVGRAVPAPALGVGRFVLVLPPLLGPPGRYLAQVTIYDDSHERFAEAEDNHASIQSAYVTVR